jgi:hypothetical protein
VLGFLPAIQPVFEHAFQPVFELAFKLVFQNKAAVELYTQYQHFPCH